MATCGQGASCAGQCSALGASLCPSGECTDDPRTCCLEFRRKNEDKGGSTATLSGSDLSWCTNTIHQCRVRTYQDCCYNPNCLEWKGRKKACSWLSYLTGNFFLLFPTSLVLVNLPEANFDECFESHIKQFSRILPNLPQLMSGL